MTAPKFTLLDGGMGREPAFDTIPCHGSACRS